MTETIVKTFIGKYMDLSKVVSISDAEFDSRMSSGGNHVKFEIHIQLLENPIKYERNFTYDEQLHYEENDGSKENRFKWGPNKLVPLAVSNLQKQIDELVEQWKEVNKNR